MQRAGWVGVVCCIETKQTYKYYISRSKYQDQTHRISARHIEYSVNYVFRHCVTRRYAKTYLYSVLNHHIVGGWICFIFVRVLVFGNLSAFSLSVCLCCFSLGLIGPLIFLWQRMYRQPQRQSSVFIRCLISQSRIVMPAPSLLGYSPTWQACAQWRISQQTYLSSQLSLSTLVTLRCSIPTRTK